MNIFEFMQILVKHGGFKFTPKEELTTTFDLGKPEFVNYAKKFERDENGNIKYKRMPIAEFEKIITAKQANIPFLFHEAAYIKSEKKSQAEDSISKKDGLTKTLLTPAQLLEKVVIIDSEEAGCGLYVIDKKGLPKGTRFLYAGVTHPNNESLLYTNCGYVCNENNRAVDNSLERGGFARFINTVPPEEMFKEKNYKTPKGKNFNFGQVAQKNADLGTMEITSNTGESAKISVYQLTKKASYGEQILGDWGSGYIEGHYAFMPFDMQIFYAHGGIIDKKDYVAPMKVCAYPNTGYYIYPTVEFFKKHIDAKECYLLIHPNKGTTYNLTPYEMQEILNYFAREEKYVAALSKDLLHKEDWEIILQQHHFKPESILLKYNDLDVHLNSQLNKKMQNPLTPNEKKEIPVLSYLEIVSLKAYVNKDYISCIKLNTWLIIQEFRRVTPLNEVKLIKWYSLLGNAYRANKQYDEAIIFFNNAKNLAPLASKEEYEKRLNDVKAEQKQVTEGDKKQESVSDSNSKQESMTP